MKKLIHLFSIVILVVIYTPIKTNAQELFPNGGFEIWESEVGGEEPVSWNSLDPMVGDTTLIKVTGTDVHSGNFAARLKTVQFIGSPAPGYLTTGTFNFQSFVIEGGNPCTLRPDSITGWFKYFPVSSDKGGMIVALLNGIDTVGKAEFITTGTTSEYTYFSAPFVYYSAFVPDTAVTVISSSIDPNGQFVGSMLFIDDLNYLSGSLNLQIDSIHHATCNGNDGYIEVSAVGTAPFTYQWNTNPVQYGNIISGINPGNYSITITDSAGTEITRIITLYGPSNFSGTDLAGHFTATGFRPNVESHIFVDVSNQGCFSLNGTAQLVLDPMLNYSGSNPAPDLIHGDTLIWDLTSVVYGSPHFTATVTVVTDLAAQIGDSVCIELTVYPFETDGDNLQTMCFPVTNSYDPNDKQVYPQGFSEHGFIANNQRMYYTVRFQNTGNAEALDIYILDTLDANLDINSLYISASSHTMITEILSGNVLKFRFDNIHLPDSNANEVASHGYVMYEIDQNPNLAVDTEIKNTAYIYFDFNAPVITNTVLNTIYDCSSSYNDPVITASEPIAFCFNDTIILDAGSGYDAYLWSTGETTQAITVYTGGYYYVSVMVDTCQHYSDTLIMYPNPIPVISVNGTTLTCTPAFQSYQWYYNGSPVITSGGTSQSLIGATDCGDYSVFVTDEYGCYAMSDSVYCPVGINELEWNNLKVYPNPASNEISVQLAAGSRQEVTASIYNAQGQLVISGVVEKQNSTIDISALSPGIYIISIFDGERQVNGKFVKK